MVNRSYTYNVCVFVYYYYWYVLCCHDSPLCLYYCYDSVLMFWLGGRDGVARKSSAGAIREPDQLRSHVWITFQHDYVGCVDPRQAGTKIVSLHLVIASVFKKSDQCIFPLNSIFWGWDTEDTKLFCTLLTTNIAHERIKFSAFKGAVFPECTCEILAQSQKLRRWYAALQDQLGVRVPEMSNILDPSRVNYYH